MICRGRDVTREGDYTSWDVATCRWTKDGVQKRRKEQTRWIKKPRWNGTKVTQRKKPLKNGPPKVTTTPSWSTS